MKKLVIFLIVAMLGLTACEGPAGPPGPPGKNGEATRWHIQEFEVLSEDWIFIEDYENDWYFFQYEFKFTALTPFIFNEGAVIGYLVHNVRYEGGQTERIQSLLPYTKYSEFEDNGWWHPYSENYSFEIRPGFINFIVKYSDWDPEGLPPTRRFRVVMMY